MNSDGANVVGEGLPAGVGAGPLSPAAIARRERGPSPEQPMPDPSDRPAGAAWRAAIHAAWGEEPDPDVTHRSAPVAGVPCLVAGPGDAPVLVHVHGGDVQACRDGQCEQRRGVGAARHPYHNRAASRKEIPFPMRGQHRVLDVHAQPAFRAGVVWRNLKPFRPML